MKRFQSASNASFNSSAASSSSSSSVSQTQTAAQNTATQNTAAQNTTTQNTASQKTTAQNINYNSLYSSMLANPATSSAATLAVPQNLNRPRRGQRPPTLSSPNYDGPLYQSSRYYNETTIINSITAANAKTTTATAAAATAASSSSSSSSSSSTKETNELTTASMTSPLETEVGNETTCLPRLTNRLNTDPKVELLSARLDTLNTAVYRAGRVQFFSSLAKHPSLNTLHLRYQYDSRISGDRYIRESSPEISSVFSVMGDALKLNSHLTTVTLSGFNDGFLKSADITHFIAGFRANTSITSLDFSSNSIGNEGAQLFAEVIPTKVQLTYLNLSHNEIYHQGALALANALSSKKNLPQTSFDFVYDGEWFSDEWLKYESQEKRAKEMETFLSEYGNENLLTQELIESFVTAALRNPNVTGLSLGVSLPEVYRFLQNRVMGTNSNLLVNKMDDFSIKTFLNEIKNTRTRKRKFHISNEDGIVEDDPNHSDGTPSSEPRIKRRKTVATVIETTTPTTSPTTMPTAIPTTTAIAPTLSRIPASSSGLTPAISALMFSGYGTAASTAAFSTSSSISSNSISNRKYATPVAQTPSTALANLMSNQFSLRTPSAAFGSSSFSSSSSSNSSTTQPKTNVAATVTTSTVGSLAKTTSQMRSKK